MKNKRQVLVIAGPTAVGKTALSIEIAKRFNGEIISGDSMQVYRGLDIGTAKATDKEQAGIPHYLLDCRDLDENYSAADFQTEGRFLIEKISKSGKLPIIVGGTGLHIQALLYNFDLGGRILTKNQQELRQKFENYYIKNGKLALWQLLHEKDSKLATAIHPNNVKRVIRKLEILENLPENNQSIAPPELLYDAKIIGLTTDRALLYERINQRVEQMLNSGLLEEAKLLVEHPDYQSAQGIGYKELFPYLQGEEDMLIGIEKVKQNSRKYAKRQLTWFRNRMNLQWFDLVQEPQSKERLFTELSNWLDKGE